MLTGHGAPCKKNLRTGDITEWPSLEESNDKAWNFCEVSSVGSSWLNIGENGEDGQSIVDDDALSSVSFEVVGEVPVVRSAKATWAALAASGSVLSTPKKPALPMPPLRHQLRPKATVRDKERLEDVEEDEFDELSERRLCPPTRRGNTQRRRQDRNSMRRCR